MFFFFKKKTELLLGFIYFIVYYYYYFKSSLDNISAGYSPSPSSASSITPRSLQMLHNLLPIQHCAGVATTN